MSREIIITGGDAHFFPWILAAISSEEAHLTEKFGTDYPSYRRGTAPAAPRRFSLERAARNREYRALAGLIAVFALFAAKYFFGR